MMNQKIGNVGLLNLLNATAESIKGIEKIENVGMVLYKKEAAHLLASLNIGNIGSTVELPEGYRFFNGILQVNKAYLQSITEPVKLYVNGLVIVDEDVQGDQINSDLLHIAVNGKVYLPSHLSGMGNLLFTTSGLIETYVGSPPRFENGELTLTNSFLQALENSLFLVVNGKLSLSKDLNLDLFMEKINKLEVNGKLTVYEEQESFLYKKITSFTTCKVDIIPEGFEVIQKPLRLNSRSIRRFKNKKLFTKKPIILEADITREMLSLSINKIQSTSIVICHEQLEDLIYECCSLLDTEVLAYEHECIFIEGDEVWSNDQFLALEHPTHFVVEGKLEFDDDVQEQSLKAHVAAIDLLGKVIVHNKKIKGVLQKLIRLNSGDIEEAGKKEDVAVLRNVGELSL